MNESRIRQVERRLLPSNDGVVTALVSFRETPDGPLCESCGKAHPSREDFERVHGRNALKIIERIVEAPAGTP